MGVTIEANDEASLSCLMFEACVLIRPSLWLKYIYGNKRLRFYKICFIVATDYLYNL
jgi:hypothetical protein